MLIIGRALAVLVAALAAVAGPAQAEAGPAQAEAGPAPAEAGLAPPDFVVLEDVAPTILHDIRAVRLSNYPNEWWHYTLVGEPYPDTFFDFPVARDSLS